MARNSLRTVVVVLMALYVMSGLLRQRSAFIDTVGIDKEEPNHVLITADDARKKNHTERSADENASSDVYTAGPDPPGLDVDPNDETIVPTKHKLHKCGGNGCIVLFFHIPKTGGRSLQETMLQHEVFYYRSTGDRQYRRHLLPHMEKWIREGTPNMSPRFLEIHAGTNPSFQSLVQSGQLRRWKQVARQHNVTLFAWTMLRQSIPWALSIFNHVCLRNQSCRPPYEAVPAGIAVRSATRTNKNISFQVAPNPQCAFLLHSGNPLHSIYETKAPTRDECFGLWDMMQQELDWIGRIESYNQTLQVLQHIVQLPLVASNVRINESHKRQPQDELLTMDQISEVDREYIWNVTQLDNMIYQLAEGHYSLDMWDFTNR